MTDQPTWMELRARVAALARRRDPDDPELVAAKDALAADTVTRKIAELLAEAPPLNEQQRATLAAVLGPVCHPPVSRDVA